MNKLTRTIAVEPRAVPGSENEIEYTASTGDLDSYRECIDPAGWRFTNFERNAPFVDSHDYTSIEKLLGQVVDFQVINGRLKETVRWAVGVGHRLADLGYSLSRAGFLKAVSVGFFPLKWLSRGDSGFDSECRRLGVDASQCSRIYLEQEQIELSAVILGANPSALMAAKAAGVISGRDLDWLSEPDSFLGKFKRATNYNIHEQGRLAREIVGFCDEITRNKEREQQDREDWIRQRQEAICNAAMFPGH